VRRLALLLAIVTIISGLWPAWPARLSGWQAGRPALGQAQQGIDVHSQEASNDFPKGIIFKLDFESEEPAKEVRFHYAIAPDGSQAYGVPECTGTTSVQCTFDLKSTPDNFLIPGVEITYFWEITDQAGRTVETAHDRCMYQDDRFHWKSLSEDGLTVWFYAGSESDMRSLLSVGQDTLTRMGSLLGTEVDFPVKVFVYDSAEDMQPVLLAGQISPEHGVITLGEVVVSDTAVVARDVSPSDILRHELSHIVLRTAVKGPFSDLPAWLEEGVAVYGQSQPLPDMTSALEAAIKSNQPFTIRSLSSASVGASGGSVSLFYGESYSVVRFLIDEYGEQKFRDLLAAFREGNRTDDALMQVYGFDQDGLENAWRQSVGLPERVIEGGQGQPSNPLPQITPFGAGESGQEQGAPASQGGAGVPVTALVVVALLTVTLAGAFAGAAVLVLRRR
jgi:hypothetical protein